MIIYAKQRLVLGVRNLRNPNYYRWLCFVNIVNYMQQYYPARVDGKEGRCRGGCAIPEGRNIILGH